MRPIRKGSRGESTARFGHDRHRSAPRRYGVCRGRRHDERVAFGHHRHHIHEHHVYVCVYNCDHDQHGDGADDHGYHFAYDNRSHDDKRPRGGAAEETAANNLDLDSRHYDYSDNRKLPYDERKDAEEDAGHAGRGRRCSELRELSGLGDRRLRGRRGADPLRSRRIPLHAHATLAGSSGRMRAAVGGFRRTHRRLYALDPSEQATIAP